MDVVLPYGAAASTDELRYALRGLDTLLGYRIGDVYLVGSQPPEWCTAKHLECKAGKDRWANTSNALLAAFGALGQREMLYMNDDFHALSPLATAVLHGTWHRGLVADVCSNNRRATSYRRGAADVLKLLGPEAKNYELHIPMVIDLSGMADAILWMRDRHMNEAYKRSVYVGLFGEGIDYGYRADVKVQVPDPEWPGDWLSTSNGSWATSVAGQLIRSTLTTPSRWEY